MRIFWECMLSEQTTLHQKVLLNDFRNATFLKPSEISLMSAIQQSPTSRICDIKIWHPLRTENNTVIFINFWHLLKSHYVRGGVYCFYNVVPLCWRLMSSAKSFFFIIFDTVKQTSVLKIGTITWLKLMQRGK